jgi:hypothetical protein
MPRKLPPDEPSQAEPPPPRVHVIPPEAVYDLVTARQALRLARGTLPREIKLGRLRAAKRAGKVLILGAWLLEWIAAGEVRRRQPSGLNGHAGGGD